MHLVFRFMATDNGKCPICGKAKGGHPRHMKKCAMRKHVYEFIEYINPAPKHTFNKLFHPKKHPGTDCPVQGASGQNGWLCISVQ